jgi:hypothetical protein
MDPQKHLVFVKRLPDEIVHPRSETGDVSFLLAHEEDGDAFRVRIRAQDLDQTLRPESPDGKV